jgi:hypothetical protein
MESLSSPSSVGKRCCSGPVNRSRGAFRIREITAVTMTMSVTMPTGVLHFAQRAERDPAAETDKSDAGGGVDDIAKPCGKGDADEPHDHSDQQSRHDVADAVLVRCACCLAPRPGTLSRDQSNWHRVIRNNGVEHANRGDGADQQ